MVANHLKFNQIIMQKFKKKKNINYTNQIFISWKSLKVIIDHESFKYPITFHVKTKIVIYLNS